MVVPILGSLLSAVASPPSYSAHTVEIRHSRCGSTSSSQGASSAREFQTEVELLKRIHHRNLASFIGYCDDIDKLALIYKYMLNENLKEYLRSGM
ncbi:hypothetical protein ACFX15_025887 [Malus domestica]